jgi:tetratricopeptide (TPR) repeat protein
MNGRHAWLFAFVAFACLAVAPPVFAQAGVVVGVVKDAKGQPVDGAKVTIESAADGKKFETKTSKNGEYSQIGLRSGAYKITVEKDKMGAAAMVSVRTGAPARTNLTLAAGGGLSTEASAKNAELLKTFNEGLQAATAGNQDEAIAKFTHATELNPACADCFFNLGLSQSTKKDYEKAEAAFKKAIENKPDHSDAYNGLANIYNAQRKFEDAAAASAKAAEFAGPAAAGGGNADSAFNQGVILWNAGKVADAKKQFEAALQINPSHAEAHYQLGMALVNEGNLAGASTELDTYLKLAPNGPNATQAKALLSQLPKQ